MDQPNQQAALGNGGCYVVKIQYVHPLIVNTLN